MVRTGTFPYKVERNLEWYVIRVTIRLGHSNRNQANRGGSVGPQPFDECFPNGATIFLRSRIYSGGDEQSSPMATL